MSINPPTETLQKVIHDEIYDKIKELIFQTDHWKNLTKKQQEDVREKLHDFCDTIAEPVAGKTHEYINKYLEVEVTIPADTYIKSIDYETVEVRTTDPDPLYPLDPWKRRHVVASPITPTWNEQKVITREDPADELNVRIKWNVQ